MTNVGYRGPVAGGVTTTPKRPDFGYQCNETTPYVPLTAVINGVDYQIDSKDNLLHPTSIESFQGGCNIGIQNATLDGREPGVTLGLAFLRSVYVCVGFLNLHYTSLLTIQFAVPIASQQATAPGTTVLLFPRVRTARPPK
jgi:hypothetical protein